jgi:hypothetical protein
VPNARKWAEESFLAMAPAHDLDRLVENLQRVARGYVIRLIHFIHSGFTHLRPSNVVPCGACTGGAGPAFAVTYKHQLCALRALVVAHGWRPATSCRPTGVAKWSGTYERGVTARSGSILVRSLVVWLMIAPPELTGDVRPVASGPYTA